MRLATNLIEENFALARANGVKVTSDAAFVRNPPIPTYVPTLMDFGRRGLLGPDVTLIHATAFPDEVFQMIRDTGTRVSLAPTSDAHYRTLGDSITPIQKVLDFGIVAGLSVDVEVTLSSDFFSQMRMAFYVQRMLANKRFTDGDTKAPVEMNPRKILEMATLNGAKCNGLENKVGSLTPGKEADILMIESDDVLNMPLNNAVGTVVLGADTSSVRNVFVGGRLMKWNGKLVGVDINKVRTSGLCVSGLPRQAVTAVEAERYSRGRSLPELYDLSAANLTTVTGRCGCPASLPGLWSLALGPWPS